MIIGIVNPHLEATLPLELLDANSQVVPVDAIVDTGFSGFLTLPPVRIQNLGLAWICRQQGMLANGQVKTFDDYSATLRWNGQVRAVEVEGSNNDPLVGMNLLEKHELNIRIVNGGLVTVQAIP